MRIAKKTGEKYIIEEVREEDIIKKITEAINRIEKNLGMEETSFYSEE